MNFKTFEKIILEERANYSFTLTITDTKTVYWKGKRRHYGELSNDDQYQLLEKQMIKINKFKDIMWVYETHEPTAKYPARLHIHGFVRNTNYDEMNSFVMDFYDKPIHLAYGGIIKCSNIQKTLVDIDYFIDYIKKEQSTIKYYMSNLQEKKESAALDGKKFKVEIKTNITPQYLNSLEEHLENRNLGDEYLFGKNKTFFVEI